MPRGLPHRLPSTWRAQYFRQSSGFAHHKHQLEPSHLSVSPICLGTMLHASQTRLFGNILHANCAVRPCLLVQGLATRAQHSGNGHNGGQVGTSDALGASELSDVQLHGDVSSASHILSFPMAC